MGILGFNRDVSSGEIFNSSYNAYQIHNFNGLLQFEAYNNSGEFIGLPINISGDYVGMGQSPNYKLDVLHTGTSSGFNTNTMSAIFQTTTGAGKHGIAIGGDVYTGNGYLQSVFNDTSTGFNMCLNPIAGKILMGLQTPPITSPNNPLVQVKDMMGVYRDNALNGQTAIVFQNTTGRVGWIDINTNSITINGVTSDYRLKENINYEFDEGLQIINTLKPCSYNYKNEKDNTYIGFIAHELQEVVPHAVTGNKDEVDIEGNIVPQGIDMTKLVPYMIKAIQELSEMNKDLQNRIDSIEQRL